MIRNWNQVIELAQKDYLLIDNIKTKTRELNNTIQNVRTKKVNTTNIAQFSMFNFKLTI